MILEFLKTVAMAYRAPRRSARAMLDRAPSMTDCALMVVLATLVQAIFGTLVDLALSGDGPSMSALGARMTEMAASAAGPRRRTWPAWSPGTCWSPPSSRR